MKNAGELHVAAQALEGKSPEEILAWAARTFGRVAFATGFGVEGCVIIEAIGKERLDIDVFTLDTGVLFPETYALWESLEARCGLTIRAVKADLSLEQQAARHGEKLWERDPNACCEIRKVMPLRQELAKFDAWITAIRRDQTQDRADAKVVEWDAKFGLVKVNPLLAWSSGDVWGHVKAHGIPFNPLHEQGYPSIGCQPCTSRVAAGEDPRAGRWRGQEKKECGLHQRAPQPESQPTQQRSRSAMSSPSTIATSRLVEPHGGTLVDRIVTGSEADALRAKAASLPKITLDAREIADLELIAVGAASPLTGFLGQRDYESVLENMRLADGTVWPLPLTLAVTDAQRETLRVGGEAALFDAQGQLWAILQISEIYSRDPKAEARATYRTEEALHPGVAYLLQRPTNLVAGEVTVLPLPENLTFKAFRFTPRELRAQIEAKGWKKVSGFQTRNPIHRAHEHLTKLALEFTDGLVIHPLVGETKGDDVPAVARFQVYEALVAKYYPKDRVILAAFPAAMRYAGPREALFHALVRKNYGIAHLCVGRDHAGVGKYYGPLEAQQMFDKFPVADVGVEPLRFDPTFFCQACGNLASTRTCPHDAGQRLELSGTKVREILRAGGNLPAEFTRPEIAEILRTYYNRASAAETPRNGAANGHPAIPVATDVRPKSGFVLWFTGLSGAGKSTLANALKKRFIGKVEVLDGDDVRQYLSKGLGFSKEDRDTNIRRIGYVARVVARNGVPVITAAISPYAETREEVKRLAKQEGVEVVEVFATAPLDALVARDTKGLYKKALAGEVLHFTGVNDPYEAPVNPDVVVHSDKESIDESVAKILEVLAHRGLIERRSAVAEVLPLPVAGAHVNGQATAVNA